ncbi:18758_t:CDS:2, partial [Racocetra persica]
RGLGEFGSEVSKDKIVIIIEAPLGVVVKIDAMIKGLLQSLISIEYNSNKWSLSVLNDKPAKKSNAPMKYEDQRKSMSIIETTNELFCIKVVKEGWCIDSEIMNPE